MNKKKFPYIELLILLAGELVVSLLVVGGYLLADLIFEAKIFDFSYRVITGVLLGCAVTVFNYLFLILSVNRAVNRFLELRGNADMDDETAEKFAVENAMPIQNAIKISFIIRTATMLATLLVAFILDWFSPLATVLPLIMFRPIITLGEFLRAKFSKPDLPLEADFTDVSDRTSPDIIADAAPYCEQTDAKSHNIQINEKQEKESDF